jgi:hypothetical protein
MFYLPTAECTILSMSFRNSFLASHETALLRTLLYGSNSENYNMSCTLLPVLEYLVIGA